MKLFLTLLCSGLALLGFSQKQVVTGLVRDKNLNPLEAVTVAVRESNTATQTDAAGRFSIEAATGQTLVFSYTGLPPITQLVRDQSPLEITFAESQSSLNEVVVTGYQRERKRDITGAVTVVNLAEIRDIPVGNPIRALQGRIPGVQINTDGSPSGAARVRIRGTGTLGNNDPLYVIDGIPTKRGLEEMNPLDIESIQVLRDAASATIYGSRAANGVFIITTKRGRANQPRIDIHASGSLQFYTSKLDVLNTQQRGEAYWRASVNDRSNPNVNQTYQYDWNGDYENPFLNRVILPEFLDAAQTMRPADTRWFDEISQTSVIQNYGFTLSNGSERSNSLLSVSYYENNGIIRESRSRRITARYNNDYNFFNNRLRVGENFSASYIKNALIPTASITELAVIAIPAVPVHTVNGGWGGPGPGMADRQNPRRLIEDNKQNQNHFVRLFGNAFAEFSITPDLVFRSSFGIDYSGNYARTIQRSYTSGFLSEPNNTATTTSNFEGNWVFQNTLNYKKRWGAHQLDVLAGHEQIKYRQNGFFASRQGLALETIDYAYLDAGSTNKDNGGNGTGYALLSYFAKANYILSNKYLASATVRRDGSSRFGSDNRYGVFPAFSLGWRLSEEAWFKAAVPALSDLKLRYSWGKTGNQEIANNATYTTYAAIYSIPHVFSYDIGTAYDILGAGTGQLGSGFSMLQQGNNGLRWESTTQSNYGLDFGFLNNRLTGSFDYFNKRTSGILISPAFLGVIGEGGARFVNGASMKNTGYELIVSYDGRLSSKNSFSISGNIAHYKNKVTKLPEEVLTSYPGNGTTQTILQRSIGSIYGYVADGLFRTQEEVDNSPAQPGKGLGRIRYRDLNKDGLIDNRDQDFIGSTDPDLLFGLNTSIQLNKLGIDFFFQGITGAEIYNVYKNLTDFSSIQPGANWGARTMDAWTPQNADSKIPALTTVDRNNEARSSTYYVESGSYLKLRNVQVSYNVNNLFGGGFVKNARFFAQASNVFIIKSKSFTATDPENPSNQYPIPFITTLGVNISL